MAWAYQTGIAGMAAMALAAAVTLAVPGTALAQEGGQSPAQDPPGADAAQAGPLSANITVASQYVSRGFRQTWGKPALQGGLDYAGPGGFAAGTWLSSVSDRYIEDGTAEWDLYGTWNGAMAYGVNLLAGVYVYRYPGARIAATGTTYNYTEVALGASWKAAYVRYYHTVSHAFFGIENARGTGYLDLGANFELGDGYTLQLHAGQGRVANNGMWNWRDYRAGISKLLAPGWTLAGTWTRAHGATDAYDRYTLGIPVNGAIATSNPATGTFVLALTRAF